MSLAAAFARGSGSVQGDINEIGSLIVATIIAGTATSNSSRVIPLYVSVELVLLCGAVSFFFAQLPIRIWFN
jgi:uncharacterized YccA/Bax inhibitor family protein